MVNLFDKAIAEGARKSLWKRGRKVTTRHRNIASQIASYIYRYPATLASLFFGGGGGGELAAGLSGSAKTVTFFTALRNNCNVVGIWKHVLICNMFHRGLSIPGTWLLPQNLLCCCVEAKVRLFSEIFIGNYRHASEES